MLTQLSFKKIIRSVGNLGFVVLVAGMPGAWASPLSFTYQGRILNELGTEPLTESAVTLTLSIYDKTGDCLLYKEEQTVDLSASFGTFSVKVGTAENGDARVDGDPGLSMEEIFKHSGVVRTAGTNCSAGYTAAPGDARKLKVSVTVGGVSRELSGSHEIGSVPFAVTAMKANSATMVGDKTADDLLTKILSEANAVSTSISKGQVEFVGGKLYFSPSATARQQVCTFDTTTAPTDGQVLKWSATNSRWEPAADDTGGGGGGGGGGTITGVTAGTGLTGGGTTGAVTLTVDTGTSAGKIVALDGAGKLPAVDGSALTSLTPANLTAGASGQFLKTTGATAGWAAVSTSDVAEGTNKYYTDARVKAAISGSTHIDVNATTGVISLTGTVPVASGGTGVTSPGTSGYVLKSNGTSWVSAAEADPTVNVVGKLDLSGCSNGQILKKNITTGNWGCEADSEGAGGTLSATLSSAYIFVGNGSNVATGRAVGGDLTMDNTGAFAVDKIKGKAVSTTAPNATGQVLTWNNAASGQWEPSTIAGILGFTPADNADVMKKDGSVSMTGGLSLLAGTTTVAPLNIPDATALKTTSAAGDLEFDDGKLYFSTAAATRENVCTVAPVPTTDDNKYLQWNGTDFVLTALPTAPTLADITGTLSVGKGGTGLTSGTSGGIPYFSASNTIASSAALTAKGVVYGGGAGAAPVATAVGTQYQVLQAGAGGTPEFGAVNLAQSAAVTGVLPVANGGSGAALTTDSALLMTNADHSAFTTITPGSANQVLLQTGVGAVSWASIGGSSITDGSIASDDLADGAVTSAKIADGTIADGDIGNATITGGKLAANIGISTTGNIATTGSGTITSAGLLTATGGITSAGNIVTTGTASITAAGSISAGAAILGKAPTAADNDGTIDFASGNVQYTTNSCGAMTLNNLTSGSAYTLVVQGASSGTCSFTAYSGSGTTGPLTVKMPSDHAATTASKHAVYTFVVAGSFLYVSWLDNL